MILWFGVFMVVRVRSYFYLTQVSCENRTVFRLCGSGQLLVVSLALRRNGASSERTGNVLVNLTDVVVPLGKRCCSIMYMFK